MTGAPAAFTSFLNRKRTVPASFGTSVAGMNTTRVRSSLVRTSVTAILAAGLLVLSPGTASSSASTDRAAGAGVRTVSFGDGVRISRPGQVERKLRRTSPSFRAYVAKRVRYLTSHDCYESGQVLVHRWRSDGWASADENSCGGAQFIYVRTPRGWRSPRALIAQEPRFCDVLRRFDVPPALLATPSGPYQCYSSDGMSMLAYV